MGWTAYRVSVLTTTTEDRAERGRNDLGGDLAEDAEEAGHCFSVGRSLIGKENRGGRSRVCFVGVGVRDEGLDGDQDVRRASHVY